MKKTYLGFTVFLALSFMLTACGGDGGGSAAREREHGREYTYYVVER